MADSLAFARPRVKPEHAPYRISGGRIRVGGGAYGLAAEIADPSGWVWTLLESMDGSRNVDQVVHLVARAHPDESPQSVRAAIDQLLASGFVEDAAAADPVELTDRDKTRYGRSRGYFRWMDLRPRASSWDPQVALLHSRVTVLGLGGTGGHAAAALAASGIGHLTCVDFDVVELSNLNRQVLYCEADIGSAKVDAAVDRLRALNSDIEIIGVRRCIEREADLRPVAEDCDVLLLAADQPPDIRRWTNRACIVTGTPWVDSGYDGPRVSVGTYVPGETGCWECLHHANDAQLQASGVASVDAERRRTIPHAVGAPSAGLSGNLAAHAVLSLLTGAPPAPAGRVHVFNLVELDAAFTIDASRRPDCPACGTVEALVLP